MLLDKDKRKTRIQSIKQSMKAIKLINHNSKKIEAKEEKNKHRKESLELADYPLSLQLIRRFSQEDEEEQRNNVNTFHEKYTILSKIGEGANAFVQSCEYKQTKKVYAVKIMTMDEEHIIELKKNFLSIMQLRHPSIIKYHALYLDTKKHTAYLVMENFPFPNLLQANVKQEQQLKIIFREVFDAARYIHEKNICHRDIKPENVLYDAELKRVKIIDFGISKKTYQRGARRDMLTIIGTSLYLAPEILFGGGYDERVDVWSIGVTMYQMIAGVTPFESEYHSDTVNNIISGKVHFNPNVWDNYSYLVKDLVTRLLKDRNERLSAKMAIKHLWLNGQGSPLYKQKPFPYQQNVKFGRTESFHERVKKAFHEDDGNNVINALSKEEGQKEIVYQHSPRRKSTIARRIHLIQNTQFDLQDSSEEESCSPEVAKERQNLKKLRKVQSN